MKRILSMTAAVAGAVLSSAALAAGYSQRNDLGEAAGNFGLYDRVIVINSDTRSVNVWRGETVKLVDTATGRNFVWHFDTAAFTVDLDRAAPGALGGQRVVAYIDGGEPGTDS